MTEKIVPGRWLFDHRSIDRNTGCWNWTGSKQSKGYGYARFNRKMYLVHRLAAFFFLDFDLNSGNIVMHKCDNPPCFNPQHLFVGTNADNTKDAMKKGRLRKGLCRLGHKITGGNVYTPPNGNRRCKLCKRTANTLTRTLANIY